MKIIFLHISDLHLETNNGINEFQIRKLADAVCSHGRFDHILIILSGDLTQSGKNDQYVVVTHCMEMVIHEIELRSKFIGEFDILCDLPPKYGPGAMLVNQSL